VALTEPIATPRPIPVALAEAAFKRGKARIDSNEYDRVAISDFTEAIRLNQITLRHITTVGTRTKAKESLTRRKPILPKRTSLRRPDNSRKRLRAGNLHARHPTERTSRFLVIW
jgi:hypothetical protein